jgi:hypothetical protein
MLAAPAPPASPSAAPHRYDAGAIDALTAMAKAASAVKDYTMTLVRREIRGDTLPPAETVAIKWQRPQRIYLRVLSGEREGLEALYAPGWNKDRVKMHGGPTLGMRVSVDPYGETAMSRVHHPVTQLGLVRLVDVVEDNVRRARAKNFGSVVSAGEETLWGRPALKIDAAFPPTGTSPTITKGQTLWDVARATGQSMYVILNANRRRGWWKPDHPEPGDAVLVPEFYGGRLVLWIDDELHLPIELDVYDHDGRLYEHYEHRDLKVNVGLTDADFDPKNEAYKF